MNDHKACTVHGILVKTQLFEKYFQTHNRVFFNTTIVKYSFMRCPLLLRRTVIPEQPTGHLNSNTVFDVSYRQALISLLMQHDGMKGRECIRGITAIDID